LILIKLTKKERRMSMDIMLDLETTGTRAGCGILTIGACSFDEARWFYERIDLKTCHDEGLKDDPETIAWWGKQTAEARMEAFSGQEPLVAVLGRFADWCQGLKQQHGKVFSWGNGADFDQPILEAAFIACDMKKPWCWDASRCYRTLKNLPENRLIKADAFEGVKHNALADATHQARHAMKILRVNKERYKPSQYQD